MPNNNYDPRPISNPARTSEIMKKYDLKMKKSLGQNFLIEPQILQRMVQVSGVDKETTVIEIGPGIGALTEFLAQSAKEVIAFEIDQRFIQILQDTLSTYDNVKVIHQDILEVDWLNPELEEIQKADKLKVVANLPYYITTPIIMNLISSDLQFDSLTMLMQKEVAQRMTAQVGSKEYNSLTIAIDMWMTSEIAFDVSSNVFIPRPNVDSSVLILKRRPQAKVEVSDPAEFEEFVQICFTQRRKTLWNNLRNGLDIEKDQQEELKTSLEKEGWDLSKRAETLTIEDFSELYKSIKKFDK